MTNKRKQDIGEAIRRFREGPRMGPPKPKAPPVPPREQEGGEFDSPGFQSPQQRIDAAKKTEERKRRGTRQVR